jgi:putative membrane protein
MLLVLPRVLLNLCTVKVMSRARSFLLGWIITTLAVLVAAKVVKGIGYDQPSSLLVATLLLGFLNAFVRPVMMFLTFPLMILTLGLFSLVINALLLLAVSFMLHPHFTVAGFGAAFWGGLIISVTTLILNSLTGTGRSRVQFQRRKEEPPRRSGDDGGPVIDV